MQPLLGTHIPSQIAIICNDIEATKQKYAEFFGMEVPPTLDGGPYEITKCEYMGEPAKMISCKMAFFQLGVTQFEIIEPYGGHSTWQDFLDETGGGIHHIAYQVPDIDAACKACESFGMKLTQKGLYGDASGAYAYYDARETLHCFIELLSSFRS
ncbi:MAG: VOC family protein [Clostridiales bacterium]|nr:VOC family protein [Clostridiales bacterium]